MTSLFNFLIKSNLSLYSLFYAEVGNEFAGHISALLRPGNTASFEEMSKWWRAIGNTVWFDRPQIWTSAFPLQRRTRYRSANPRKCICPCKNAVLLILLHFSLFVTSSIWQCDVINRCRTSCRHFSREAEAHRRALRHTPTCRASLEIWTPPSCLYHPGRSTPSRMERHLPITGGLIFHCCVGRKNFKPRLFGRKLEISMFNTLPRLRVQQKKLQSSCLDAILC